MNNLVNSWRNHKAQIAIGLISVNLFLAVIGGFLVQDTDLYHWPVCFVLGLSAGALGIAERKPWIAGIGLFSAVFPAVLMFGSWFVYTVMNIS